LEQAVYDIINYSMIIVQDQINAEHFVTTPNPNKVNKWAVNISDLGKPKNAKYPGN
jgi:hypothetical protein